MSVNYIIYRDFIPLFVYMARLMSSSPASCEALSFHVAAIDHRWGNSGYEKGISTKIESLMAVTSKHVRAVDTVMLTKTSFIGIDRLAFKLCKVFSFQIVVNLI